MSLKTTTENTLDSSTIAFNNNLTSKTYEKTNSDIEVSTDETTINRVTSTNDSNEKTSTQSATSKMTTPHGTATSWWPLVMLHTKLWTNMKKSFS